MRRRGWIFCNILYRSVPSAARAKVKGTGPSGPSPYLKAAHLCAEVNRTAGWHVTPSGRDGILVRAASLLRSRSVVFLVMRVTSEGKPWSGYTRTAGLWRRWPGCRVSTGKERTRSAGDYGWTPTVTTGFTAATSSSGEKRTASDDASPQRKCYRPFQDCRGTWLGLSTKPSKTAQALSQ